MNKLRRALPFLLSLLLMLPACSPPPPADDFAYAASPFTAALRGSYTLSDGVSRPIAATVAVGEVPTVGSSTDRAMTVTFTQPPALEGVVLSSAYQPNGEGQMVRTVTFTSPSAYGEVTASSDAGSFDGFLRFAEALLPLGDVVSISPVAEDGTHTVTRKTSDGEWEAVYLFSAEHALPLRITVTRPKRGEVMELVVQP